nr:MAG TPA: hypothetical protein [Caudoviricetes sp.]
MEVLQSSNRIEISATPLLRVWELSGRSPFYTLHSVVVPISSSRDRCSSV